MIATFEDVQTTILKVQAFSGPAEDFHLLVPDTMNDPSGAAMTIVTDAILAKGWLPDGFTEGDGYRIYKYAM